MDFPTLYPARSTANTTNQEDPYSHCTIHEFKMFRWKCLEGMAGGHHNCDLTCIVDGDEENKNDEENNKTDEENNKNEEKNDENKEKNDENDEGNNKNDEESNKNDEERNEKATAIKSQVDGNEGNNKRATTVQENSDNENNKTGTAIESQVRQLNDTLSRLADDRQSSDETFASPEKGFEDLAGLLKQISQAVKGAEGNATSSEQDKYVEELNNFHQFLFHDTEIKSKTPLYSQLSIFGQRAVTQAASAHWDRLLECLRKTKDVENRSSLDTVLKQIHSGNRRLKALVRQYALDSEPFRDPAALEQISRNDAAVELGLGADAELRARNLRLRVSISSVLFR